MTVKPIPEGYHTVNPYILVNDAHKLITFLKDAFGAQVKDMSEHNGKVVNAEIKVGTSMVMVADVRGDCSATPSSFYCYVEDTDATYKQALQAGGESLMEPADQFYGDRNAGVKDFAGNQWWISTHIEDVPREEMDKRMQKYKTTA